MFMKRLFLLLFYYYGMCCLFILFFLLYKILFFIKIGVCVRDYRLIKFKLIRIFIRFFVNGICIDMFVDVLKIEEWMKVLI